MIVTFFDDPFARAKHERDLTGEALAEIIRTTKAPAKDRLPWLKLGRFGEQKTEKGSLRHDANITEISGIEADYDGERIGFYKAEQIARDAGLDCIIYTSPSHRPERPRWRILCPLSCLLSPVERNRLLSWAHGLYSSKTDGQDVFAGESWTLSQSYYLGAVGSGTHHRVVCISGSPLDRLESLAATARGKPQTQSAGNGSVGPGGRIDEPALLELVRTGTNYHNAAIRLVGYWARQGLSYTEAEARIRTAFDAVDTVQRDQRWRDRVGSIPDLLDHVFGREAARAAQSQNGSARSEAPAVDEAPQWPSLDDAALCGLPGDVVRAISPHSEGDPVAILVQYLAAAGNAIGRGPHYRVEGDRHGPNLFVVLIAETAKGRKGTSWGRVRQTMEGADRDWTSTRIQSGLSSGEGLIWAVRDPIMGIEKRGKGAAAERVEVETDSGVSDKRLLIVEPELARTITVMRRDGNTLSAVVRDAWDRGDLSSLTKNSPARATGAHISIIGHITADELRATLDRVAMANGSANRFLWLMARRGEVLPFGGALGEDTIAELGRRTRDAIQAARRVGCIAMTADARQDWATIYSELSEGKPGLLGAITARAEAQVIRLAVIYALLDGRPEIDVEHLHAALAVWEYSEASATFIWGDALGDPVADEILRFLRQAGADGRTRTEIRDLFGRHRSGEEIGAGLGRLAAAGKVARCERQTAGRPVEIWRAGYGRS